jgi:hypothetical protein
MMDRKEAAAICDCDACPTYVECGEMMAFCLGDPGKSSCIVENVACICPGCRVHDQLNLLYEYYCTSGSEKELHAQP